MNSQCRASWMCWRMLGSRALCNCLRFKKSERREIFCETFLLCVGGCWWFFFFVMGLVWLFRFFACLDFCLFVLVLPSDDLFWSHSAVDELSIGLVSEENSILVCPSYCWKLPEMRTSQCTFGTFPPVLCGAVYMHMGISSCPLQDSPECKTLPKRQAVNPFG